MTEATGTAVVGEIQAVGRGLSKDEIRFSMAHPAVLSVLVFTGAAYHEDS